MRAAAGNRVPAADVYGRFVAVACIAGCSIAAVSGVVKGFAVYPLRSIPAVVLYLTMLASIPSAVLGTLVASLVLLVRRRR